jgi:adenylyltransferase/sulfurtransferase
LGLKLILGVDDSLGKLFKLDVWNGRTTTLTIEKNGDCPACAHGRYPFLDAERTAWTTRMCGRNAIQITPSEPSNLDLDEMARTLARSVDTDYNGLLLTVKKAPYEIVLFPDGRSMVKGTDDEVEARTILAKIIGS